MNVEWITPEKYARANWIQQPRHSLIPRRFRGPELRVWHLIDHDAPTYRRTICGAQVFRDWTKLRKSEPRMLRNTEYIHERICKECHLSLSN